VRKHYLYGDILGPPHIAASHTLHRKTYILGNLPWNISARDLFHFSPDYTSNLFACCIQFILLLL